MQMALMQQQLDVLNQNENVGSQEAAATPRRSSGRREVRKNKEGEASSTNIPALKDAQLTRKVK